MDKKSQAALEFLMTYAWAIFAVMVLLAVLFSLGIINIKDKLPEQAKFQPPFSASEAVIDEYGTITIKMQSVISEEIIISESRYSGTNLCSTITAFSSDRWTIGPQEEFTLSFTCPDGAGKRVYTHLTFSYNKTSSNMPHDITGYVVVNG